jgi:hypothetical protein
MITTSKKKHKSQYLTSKRTWINNLMSSKRIQSNEWNYGNYAGYERGKQWRYGNPET